MADTTNVGEIAVEIVANTQRLERNCASAATTVNSFSSKTAGSVNQVTSAFARVELGAKDAKQAFGNIGASFGAQGNVFATVAKSVLEMGPALGIAVAAFEIYNTTTKEAADNTAKIGTNAEAYMKTLERIGELTGKTEVAGAFESDVASRIKDIDNNLKDMQAQLEKSSSAFMVNGAEVQNQTALIARATRERAELMKMANQQRNLDTAKGSFDTDMFNNKYSTAADSAERLVGEVDALQKYNQELLAVLAKLPEKGTLYNKVLQEQRAVTLQILDAQDALYKKQLEREAAAKKAAEDYVEGMNLMKKLREDAIAADAAASAKKMKKILDEAAKRDEKRSEQSIKETVKTGFAMQLDTSRVSVNALRMAEVKTQKVSDPALEITNQLLGKVVEKVGSAGGPARMGK